MENKITYSILIPTYNVQSHILKAIQSCFDQTYRQNFEIIVCDDGSTDNTYSILQNIKNIKLLRNEINSKGVITRNKLINAARGEYIIWLDSDDTLQPKFLEIVDNLLTHKRYDMIQVSLNFKRNNSVVNQYCYPDRVVESNHLLDYFFNNPVQKFVLWGKVIKREIMTKQMPDNKYQEFDDVFYALPLFCNSKSICYTSNILYNYNVDTGYWTKINNRDDKISLQTFKNILFTRKEEWEYNASFLYKTNPELFEKYKYHLLKVCDYQSMLQQLIKIENAEERQIALSLFEDVFDNHITVRNKYD